MAEISTKDRLTKLGLTCIAASISESVTYPIDMVKTRLQLQGQSMHSTSVAAKPKTLGAFAMAKEIIKEEGLPGLYAGLPPAVVRHIFYTGTRITVYEQLRSYIGGDGQEAVGLGTKLLLGLSAGAIGQTVAVPADLMKVRMQADGRMVALGLRDSRRYKSLGSTFSSILREDGVRGLWRGAGPAVQRAALVNLGELTTYDTAKRAWLSSGIVEEGVALHLLSAVCSGFFASLVSVPADVVKTRMMTQEAGRAAAGSTAGKPAVPGVPPSAPSSSSEAAPLARTLSTSAAPVRYTGSLDCLRKTVQNEGFGALYKGFFPTWARLGPWQLVFWTTYEHIRSVCGLGSF